MQTVFALATARGKAGVAIIRISGPEAASVGAALCGSLPEPGQHALRVVRNANKDILDQSLILFFTAPNSFTGEDVVEMHLHGSVAVIRAVEDAIAATGLAREAEAGEFTKRALLNDRLDLAQVEGLGDLVEAETEAQRVQAQRAFSGALSEKMMALRDKGIRAAALLTATIDFADEEVPVDVSPEVEELLTSLIADLKAEIEGSRVAERVRDGFEVAILGAPNAGKSTLLNALSGREIAITSDIAGTTRDVIEARLDIGGLAVTFLDTAGLRATDDTVEQIGVSRAIDRALSADLRVVLETDDFELPEELQGRVDLIYGAKADLTGRKGISGVTGAGLDEMISDISGILSERVAQVKTAISARQRGGMQRAVVEFAQALSAMRTSAEVEIAAQHVQDGLHALDSVIGRVDVENILGEIFSRFCIGK
ncbi:tRNA uridine-5-carboxymethylaminomethyl(34) synthesis GTPase MnmE [Gymnodinialimonas hymeniacidonis]|uniref:tRNA uridine-5-carboxymethylaminomethyl(34) synthesis GTPase MnmE n=1 Tax=Gymnodinialimonas hymeniacidonis TaxID=3126508 RepID=UPI0034C5B7DF